MINKHSILIIAGVLFVNGCATMPRQPTLTPPSPVGVYHIVGRGQTLWRIAKTYNVNIQEIMRVNRIRDPRCLGVGEELFIPRAKTVLLVEPYKRTPLESIEKILGPRHLFSFWNCITIHHSATLEGDAERFDQYHRKRRMGGLFYHFVIGNGTGSEDGEVEVGWRWRRQVWANRPFDIEICLVGNFNRQQVSEAQFSSLIKLISILCRQYGIPLSNIRRHKDIEDKVTDCPGENFPFQRLLSELKKIRP